MGSRRAGEPAAHLSEPPALVEVTAGNGANVSPQQISPRLNPQCLRMGPYLEVGSPLQTIELR